MNVPTMSMNDQDTYQYQSWWCLNLIASCVNLVSKKFAQISIFLGGKCGIQTMSHSTQIYLDQSDLLSNASNGKWNSRSTWWDIIIELRLSGGEKEEEEEGQVGARYFKKLYRAYCDIFVYVSQFRL